METTVLMKALSVYCAVYRKGTIFINKHVDLAFALSLVNVRTKERPKHTKIVCSECLLRLAVLCDSFYSMCLCMYQPFCHGALKLDPYTLSTSIQSILQWLLLIHKI